jgi:hypothetical protein
MILFFKVKALIWKEKHKGTKGLSQSRAKGNICKELTTEQGGKRRDRHFKQHICEGTGMSASIDCKKDCHVNNNGM